MTLRTTKNKKKKQNNFYLYPLMIILLIIILILLGLIIKKFFWEKEVIDNNEYEVPQFHELISCQSDCSFKDHKFYEECIGFNGCEDSLYIRNQDYCEKDSDCVVNLGCCANEAKGKESKGLAFCDFSNSKYEEAHLLSCGSVKCKEEILCRTNYELKCVEHKCIIK